MCRIGMVHTHKSVSGGQETCGNPSSCHIDPQGSTQVLGLSGKCLYLQILSQAMLKVNLRDSVFL